MTEQPAPQPAESNARTCPWCAAAAADEAVQCATCGAALAQRETIGDLRIPGLTSVDPALEDFDKRPLHLRGPSPSQGMAPALIVGAMAGGPIGLAAIGGVAAVAAAEYIGASRGAGGSPEDVGKPSEAVLQALSRLEEKGGQPSAPGAKPSADTAPGANPDTPAADGSDAAPATLAGDDRDIWRDLPVRGPEPNDDGADEEHEEPPDGE